MIRWNEAVWKRTQAVGLWLLGAAGIANELFRVPGGPRPASYPIIGMLIGLPFAQAADRARQATSGSSPEPVPEVEPERAP